MRKLRQVTYSLAIAALTVGAVGCLGLSASAGMAEAKSEKAGSNRGKSEERGKGQRSRGKGRGAAQDKGACPDPVGQMEGLAVYSLAVTAVQGAQDALDRAAARLSNDQIPGPDTTPAALKAAIDRVEREPRTGRNRAVLRLLNLQLDFVEARADLTAKQDAQTQARQYASRGRAMSSSALAILQETC